MGKTQNFGLNKFGAEGRISDDGYKFSNKDRDLIDTLLYTLFQHDHRVVAAPVSSPEQAPVLTLSTSGGSIPAGTDLYYGISFVDTFGNETAISPLAYLRSPEPLEPPGTPTLSTSSTGGSLAGGTYRYAVAFYQSSGGVTRAPNDQSIIVPTTTSTNTITVSLETPPSGADGWNIYRKAPGEDEFYFLTQVAAGATPPTSWTDDGTVSPDCTKRRPTVNTTNSTNSVTVAINSADLPLPSTVGAWRIYKTTTNGVFGPRNLLAHVVDTTTEGGADLVTSYLDVGAALLEGTPIYQSTIPPSIPQIDAGESLDTSGKPLPALLAPRGLHQFYCFLPGSLTAKTYNQVYITESMDIERIDAFFLTAPTGVDASNYVTIRVRDDSLVNEVQQVYNDAAPVNEVQKVSNTATGGTFTLTFNGQTTAAIAYDATASAVESALEALSNITDVYVYGTGTSADPWVVEFRDPGGQDVPQMTADDANLTGGTTTITTTIQGSDGGTFTLTFDGQTTSALAYNATAAQVEAALEALSNITDVTVTGTGVQSDPWVVTFVNPGSQDVAELTADDTNLAGTTTITTVTEGRGNTVVDLDVKTTSQYQYWQSSTTDYQLQEAEEAPATGGTVVSDTLALNDQAAELAAQNDVNSWNAGVLQAGDYRFRFWVADPDGTATALLEVVDVAPATPVVLASQSVSPQRSVYTPFYELKASLSGAEDITLRVTKTDSGTGRVRVDRYEYEVDLPTLYKGQMMTIEVLVNGTPTTNGSDVQLTIWY